MAHGCGPWGCHWMKVICPCELSLDYKISSTKITSSSLLCDYKGGMILLVVYVVDKNEQTEMSLQMLVKVVADALPVMVRRCVGNP